MPPNTNRMNTSQHADGVGIKVVLFNRETYGFSYSSFHR